VQESVSRGANKSPASSLGPGRKSGKGKKIAQKRKRSIEEGRRRNQTYSREAERMMFKGGEVQRIRGEISLPRETKKRDS